MRTFIILMATIFLTLLNSCSGQKKETREELGQGLYDEPGKSVYIETIKNNFEPILNNFIDLVDNEYSDINIITVFVFRFLIKNVFFWLVIWDMNLHF